MLGNNENNISTIRLAGIVEESIVDGDGIRFAIFVQGCTHKCKGCHNTHTHDKNGGEVYNISELCARIKTNPLLAGVTFSGGEPFLQAGALCSIAKFVKSIGQNVWCYSGYTLEELQRLAQKNTDIAELLSLVDTLVDGPFIQEQKDLTLKFRGSKNQRIIKLR